MKLPPSRYCCWYTLFSCESLQGVRLIAIYDAFRLLTSIFSLVIEIVTDLEGVLKFYYIITFQIFASIRSYRTASSNSPSVQILTNYYKIKFVVAIGIIICWVIVAQIGCDSSCSSGEVSYISVVVSISEALDLYFAYVIYSASILISRGPGNVNNNPPVRVEPVRTDNLTNVHHFGVREGINIDHHTDQALFERTDLVVALPIDSSLEDIKPPPLSKIKIQDYTKNAFTAEDGNISR